MFEFLIDNEITEICDLVDYAKINRPDWFDQIVNSDYLMMAMITSRRHKKEQQPPTVNATDVAKLVDEL